MDTILLFIAVVGLSISGWVLRGYFLNTPLVLTPAVEPALEVDSNQTDQEEPEEDQISYVTSEDHQLVLKRLAELEKGGYVPKVAESVVNQPNDAVQQTTTSTGEATQEQGLVMDNHSNEAPVSESWKEILALQNAYHLAREQEKDIDYQHEQTIFDITQGYDGQFPGQSNSSLTEEQQLDQKLLDNQLEDGEDIDTYQERMSQFASLTREMLVMRLDATDRQLREQQEKHQATLLNIISTLIERMPQDTNLKSVIQSTFVSASTEISNTDGEVNRGVFSAMFLDHLKG